MILAALLFHPLLAAFVDVDQPNVNKRVLRISLKSYPTWVNNVVNYPCVSDLNPYYFTAPKKKAQKISLNEFLGDSGMC